jgi:hypothetical protein
LALDEPESDDKVVVINEIQVAMESDLEEYTLDLTLEFDRYRESFYWSGNDFGC